MPLRHLPWMCALPLLAAGCLMTTSWQVDREVNEIAALCGEANLPSGSDLLPPPAPAVDTSVPKALASLAAPPFAPSIPANSARPPDGPKPPDSSVAAGSEEKEQVPTSLPPVAEPERTAYPIVAVQEIPRIPKKFRLEIPRDLPGANAPPIRIPPGKEARAYLQKLYPPIPPVPPLPPEAPGPEGRPISLADLQHYGETYSPAVKAAEAAVMAARGAAFDVGQYPNPMVGYEHDTVETGPAGYPGGYIDQLIKTGGKLTVAQAAAVMDLLNARLALRRAKSDVRYQVRGFYFAVLVARENARVSDALFRFANELYQTQISIVGGGFGATYEPMQLRPLVLQAQLNVIMSHNQYRAAWRQLAAAIGLPDMPCSELEGSIDMPIPTFEFEELVHRLDHHTDVLTAYVNIQKAKYNVKTQQLVNMPDVGFRWLMQKDYTTPPQQIAHSAIMYATIPLWYQNQGGIRQAQWQLAQYSVGPAQARNALIVTLADSFSRYQTAQRTVAIVREQIADQVRVYRSMYDRRQTSPDQVMFNDLVTAQQTLAGFIAGYITALGGQWQAVVDLANYLQTEDLAGTGPPQGVDPVPDLRKLMPPPSPVPVVYEKTAKSAKGACSEEHEPASGGR